MQLRPNSASRRTLVAVLALAALGTMRGASDAAPPAKPNTARLTIDYNDGVQKVFAAVPWKQGQTVLDVLQWADKHPRGIELDLSGSGATAFVKSIDRLPNEGGGASAHNWLYRRNGKLGTIGAGSCEVHPGDEIIWQFGVYKPSDN